MGQRLSKAKPMGNKQVQLYSQQTQLQPTVIQQIYDAFMDRAGKGGRMNLNEFKLAYPQINPNVNFFNLDADAERVFMTFDTDHNGILTFDEFIVAFIQMQRGNNNPLDN